MTSKDSKVNVVLFSGGRGAASISAVLNKRDSVNLTVLVNAYDDGLSTGRIRGFIPKLLGPSDIRKNISTLMPQTERGHVALKSIIEYRLPLGTKNIIGRKIIRQLSEMIPPTDDENISNFYREIKFESAQIISFFCRAFSQHEDLMEQAGVYFDYGDCSIGNIFLAGAFLEAGCNFNQAIESFSRFAGLHSNVLNITNGENYILTGIKADGSILTDESAIVSPNGDDPVSEIFLLNEYLSFEKLAEISGLGFDDKRKYLLSLERQPESNPKAVAAIENADIIIYGPGTQFSSLFPSYLTRNIAFSIIKNENAIKIFIGNIGYDNDIKSQTLSGLLKNFYYYMSKGSDFTVAEDKLITKIFAQEPDYLDLNRHKNEGYIPVDIENIGLHSGGIFKGDWERSAGGHSGTLIADQILQMIEERIAGRVFPARHTVSIIVPALNEIKTIGMVLNQLRDLSFEEWGLDKEILIVDGGSDDGTLDAAKQFPFARIYSSKNVFGRGAALRLGISKARGDVIVFFPSDNEYLPNDIKHLVKPIIDNEFLMVFGSRVMKCFNFDEVSSRIYGENKVGAFLSKYGGLILSLCCLLKCNRFITDPLTTLKAFDSKTIKSLSLTSNGVELETELIVKASKYQHFILEVPVSYRPRGVEEGKKITARDGLRAMWRIFCP